MNETALNRWAKERGYRIGYGGPGLLDRAHKKLEQLRADGEIDPLLFQDELEHLLNAPQAARNSGSLIILAAVPRPAYLVPFDLGHGIVEFILPPTYVGYRALFENIRRDLQENVFIGDMEVHPLEAPLKTLAVWMGLASYGRNNLSYIPEFGSYYQLAGFLVRADIEDPSLAAEQGPKMLEACSRCRACLKICPAAAISGERFLLHAEKCHTFHSESSRPLPPDLPLPVHKCLIGCIDCQILCPANRGRLAYERTTFQITREETDAILENGSSSPEAKTSAVSKFKTLGLSEPPEILFRNFRMFVSEA